MTVNELYALAKNITFEKSSSTIYDDYLIGNVNRILTELFEENNMCRMFKGKAPFREIPFVSSTSDEIEYENEYIYDVMPLGLAAYFMIDDDLNKYTIYSTNYNNARVMHQKMVSKEVIDAFTE